MSVTLADVDRWDPSAVREVATALGKRGASADEVKSGLSRLPLIASWQGSGGDAARAALDKLSTHLAAHADEMASIAASTNKAADEIDSVRQRLQAIYRDASAERFDVDRASGAVTPLDKTRAGDPMYFLQQMDLENRIAKVLADANAADADLARAITTAGSDATGPAEDRPDVRAALAGHMPDDPKQFHDLWERLTPEEKDWLYQQDHSIGNHGGMPFVDRNHYNQMHLDELARANQADLDRLRAAHPDWAKGGSGAPSEEWQQWNSQWQAANKTHQQYEQVRKALQSPDGLPRLLGTLDDRGHAAVSINNPDTARRDATFVPGTGQDLGRLEFSTSKSEQMLQATLRADPSLRPQDVSVTTWMGYDRPMNVFTDAPSPSYAHNGAQALDDFQAGMRASHNDLAAGGPSINTVIGHSYGSTLVGAAGLDGHHLDANNVVAVGSPGILAQHASDLNLDPGAHVFASRAENDIIGIATYATLGPDPMSANFGGIPFEAAPGPAGPFGLPTIDAHSSYWSAGNPALDNMGRIIAGQTTVTPPTFTP